MGVYEINVPNVYSIMQANALYAYCGNNSVIFVDPSGQLAWDMDAGYNLVGDYYTDEVL